MMDVEIIIALALQATERRLPLRDLLPIPELRRRQGKIRRKALLPPEKSPFMVLYETGQDDALITLCGFDHHSFGLLHELFKPFFDNYSPMIFNYGNGLITKKDSSERRGRPRSITSIMCLGLVLAWTRTRGSYMVLQLIFGLTSTRLSIWLRFGRRVLIRILKAGPSFSKGGATK